MDGIQRMDRMGEPEGGAGNRKGFRKSYGEPLTLKRKMETMKQAKLRENQGVVTTHATTRRVNVDSDTTH